MFPTTSGLLCLSTCHSNCIDNLFSSYRWIPEVEEFQLSSRNSSGIDCLSCFSSFIGPLHSLGNDPFSTCYSPEQLRKLCYKTINYISSKETIFFILFLSCRASCLRSFHGSSLSSEASAMLTGPPTSGLCTTPRTKRSQLLVQHAHLVAWCSFADRALWILGFPIWNTDRKLYFQ